MPLCVGFHDVGFAGISCAPMSKYTHLCEDPFPSGVKKLRGEPDHFRVRVGDYRVIYRIDGHRVGVVIVQIVHRREVYR
jgi:mRNA interferase RelE/StbE